jgi:hypothetical protein
MNLDQLKNESRADLPIIDQEHLDQEGFKNQIISPKWLDYRTRFKSLLIKNKGNYQRLYREKWEYYGGKSDVKVYVAKPFDLKVLKTDLHMYITSDEEIIALADKISYLETILEFIDGILKSIDRRGWDIKNAQDWKRFEAGMI